MKNSGAFQNKVCEEGRSAIMCPGELFYAICFAAWYPNSSKSQEVRVKNMTFK